MKDLTAAELSEVQKMTDDYAKNFTARKQASAVDRASAFGQPERTEAAFNDIKRLSMFLVHPVADSIKKFVLKRNLEAQKKKEKAKQNAKTSSPFWY